MLNLNRTIGDLANKISKSVRNEVETFDMVVRRSNVLQDA